MQHTSFIFDHQYTITQIQEVLTHSDESSSDVKLYLLCKRETYWPDVFINDLDNITIFSQSGCDSPF